MEHVATCANYSKLRHFVRPCGREWLVIERNVRIVGSFPDLAKAERLCAYLNGGLPDDDAAGWERVYAAAAGAEGSVT